MEFVILTIFMLIFFIVMFAGLQDQIGNAHEARNEELATELASLINTEVILSGLVNPGYVREFYLPSTLDSTEYSLSLVDDYDLEIGFRQKTYLFFLDGNGTPIIPLEPGLNTITN